jgi:hypothetical protein
VKEGQQGGGVGGARREARCAEGGGEERRGVTGCSVVGGIVVCLVPSFCGLMVDRGQLEPWRGERARNLFVSHQIGVAPLPHQST